MGQQEKLAEAIADILRNQENMLQDDISAFLDELDALPREYGMEVRRVKKILHDGRYGSQLYQIYNMPENEQEKACEELIADIVSHNLMNADLAKKTIQIFLDAWAIDKKSAEPVKTVTEPVATTSAVEMPMASDPLPRQKPVPPAAEVSASTTQSIQSTLQSTVNQLHEYANSPAGQSFMDKYFSCTGRLNRWAYFKRGFVLSLLVGIFLSLGDIGAIFNIPTAVSLWMQGVRRLHDLDKSGRWMLWCIIPGINLLLGLYMTFFKGTDGDNQYGPDPLRQ